MTLASEALVHKVHGLLGQLTLAPLRFLGEGQALEARNLLLPSTRGLSTPATPRPQDR